MNRTRSASWKNGACAAVLAALVLGASSPAFAQAEEVIRTLSPQISVSPGWTLSVGESVTLDASRSTHDAPAEETDEVRYTWILGDGTTRVGERITHRYPSPSTYDIELRMEIFETGGVFHRATDRRQIVVTAAEMPTLVGVIDLETGFALTGGSYAAIIQIEDKYLLLDPSGTTLVRGRADAASQGDQDLTRQTSISPSWVVGPGILSIDSLLVLGATLAWELETEPWLVTVGLGSSTRSTSVSLTPSDPVLGQGGYTLRADIERVSLAALGLGYHATERLCLLGSVGVLQVAGRFEGSSRVLVDGVPLPYAFFEYRPTWSLGAGIRLDWLLLSMQLLLLL